MTVLTKQDRPPAALDVRPSPEIAAKSPISRIGGVALALGALWFVLAYLWVATHRCGYPYDLEWMEGATLEHVARIVEHRPLYGPPSAEFIPFLYTPLYYFLCAPFCAAMGLALPVLRAISIGASLGVFVALYALVRRTTADQSVAWLAVGVFASTYVVCGAWMDLARVDSVFLCLTAFALYLVVRSDRDDGVAGLLFAAAFCAKQSAAVVALPLCLLRLYTGRGWRRARLLAATAVPLAAVLVTLDARSDGWFRFYAFTIPRSHPFTPENWTWYWHHDLFWSMPIACAAAIFVLGRRAPERAIRVAAGVGLLGASWLGRLNTGGAENTLLPAMLFLAWMTAEAFCVLRAHAAWRGALRVGAYLLVAAQLAMRGYALSPLIPSTDERHAWDSLVAFVRATPGPVFVPHHPSLARMAGKRPSAHALAMVDIYRSYDERATSLLARSLETALRAEYRLVVLDAPSPASSYADVPGLAPALPDLYTERPLALDVSPALMTMHTGWALHPSVVWSRR